MEPQFYSSRFIDFVLRFVDNETAHSQGRGNRNGGGLNVNTAQLSSLNAGSTGLSASTINSAGGLRAGNRKTFHV